MTLFLQHCQIYVVRLTLMVYKKGAKNWLPTILLSVVSRSEQHPGVNSSQSLLKIHSVHPHSSMNTASARKKYFILSDRSNFYMIYNLSIVLLVYTRRMLTSFFVNKMLLPRYVNWSANSWGFPLRVEIVPFYLKHIFSVLFAFT